MFKGLAAAMVATLSLSASALAQAAGNGVSTPAEQGTLTGPSHRTDNRMGEGRANAPDTDATDNNSAWRGTENNPVNENRAARDYGK